MVHGPSELGRGLSSVAETTAHAAAVARVGIWFLSARGEELTCAYLHQRDKAPEQQGSTLKLADYPAYAAALTSRRVISASDARTAPETAELTESYLSPNGITSMLDAPIYRGGWVVGVVCLEHTGPRREWTQREGDLAASVADIVAVLLEQAARFEAEQQLRRQQDRLAKAEKLDALMRFSAGVAHDFNNVLAVMRGYLEVLKRGVPPGQSPIELLDEALDAADLGKRIVSQLLTYCRGQPSYRRELDLSKTLRDLLPIVSSAAGEKHKIGLDAGPDKTIVHADRTQIEQLLLNLVVNARDAMPSGGEIRIGLTTTADWAVLKVSDRGSGIDAAARDRIFEPFFTTKGDRGTGLDLSTCQTIVEQHGGKITLDSSVGEGTTFTVMLPLTEG